MTDTSQPRPSTSAALALGAALIGLGVILNLFSRLLDGFPQGLFLGAGVMLIVLGVFALSGAVRRQLRGGAEPVDTWLPSRDDDR